MMPRERGRGLSAVNEDLPKFSVGPYILMLVSANLLVRKILYLLLPCYGTSSELVSRYMTLPLSENNQ
jgi:hypothetical protein